MLIKTGNMEQAKKYVFNQFVETPCFFFTSFIKQNNFIHPFRCPKNENNKHNFIKRIFKLN